MYFHTCIILPQPAYFSLIIMRYEESHRRKEDGIVPGREKDGVKNRKDDIEIRRATIEDDMRQAYVHEE